MWKLLALMSVGVALVATILGAADRDAVVWQVLMACAAVSLAAAFIAEKATRP